MDERRRHERFASVFPSEVRERQGGRIVGLVADISSGGLMLRTQAPRSTGQDLQLIVELPPDRQPREVPIEARVSWCESDIAPGTFVVGLAFCGTTAPDGPVAMDLLHALKSVG
jgi:hypothetical protein